MRKAWRPFRHSSTRTHAGPFLGTRRGERRAQSLRSQTRTTVRGWARSAVHSRKREAGFPTQSSVTVIRSHYPGDKPRARTPP